MRVMTNQHAGLSQALAEQHMTQRRAQADHTRYVMLDHRAAAGGGRSGAGGSWPGGQASPPISQSTAPVDPSRITLPDGAAAPTRQPYHPAGSHDIARNRADPAAGRHTAAPPSPAPPAGQAGVVAMRSQRPTRAAQGNGRPIGRFAKAWELSSGLPL